MNQSVHKIDTTWNWLWTPLYSVLLFLKGVEDISQTCTSNQSSTDNTDMCECTWRKWSFLEAAEQHKGEYTATTERADFRNNTSRSYLQNVVKCLSITICCGWHVGKMLEITPAWKFSHANGQPIDQIGFQFYDTQETTHFWVSAPFCPESASVVKRSSHICFPHFPSSSEWRVS